MNPQSCQQAGKLQSRCLLQYSCAENNCVKQRSWDQTWADILRCKARVRRGLMWLLVTCSGQDSQKCLREGCCDSFAHVDETASSQSKVRIFIAVPSLPALPLASPSCCDPCEALILLSVASGSSLKSGSRWGRDCRRRLMMRTDN